MQGPAGVPSYEAFTFTLTATGFSGTAPSALARYVKIGTQVTLMVPGCGGTSNATTFTLTGLPTALRPALAVGCGAQVQDSGVYGTVPGFVFFDSASSTITLYKDIAGATWTASGAKAVSSFSIAYLVP